jgi:hypothetical protein
MAFSTGEVVETTEAEHPFKVVFSTGSQVIAEWPVSSRKEGEQQIVDVLNGLRKLAQEQGYL